MPDDPYNLNDIPVDTAPLTARREGETWTIDHPEMDEPFPTPYEDLETALSMHYRVNVIEDLTAEEYQQNNPHVSEAVDLLSVRFRVSDLQP